MQSRSVQPPVKCHILYNVVHKQQERHPYILAICLVMHQAACKIDPSNRRLVSNFRSLFRFIATSLVSLGNFHPTCFALGRTMYQPTTLCKCIKVMPDGGRLTYNNVNIMLRNVIINVFCKKSVDLGRFASTHVFDMRGLDSNTYLIQ